MRSAGVVVLMALVFLGTARAEEDERSVKSLYEAALRHEEARRYRTALACYEKVLELDEDYEGRFRAARGLRAAHPLAVRPYRRADRAGPRPARGDPRGARPSRRRGEGLRGRHRARLGLRRCARAPRPPALRRAGLRRLARGGHPGDEEAPRDESEPGASEESLGRLRRLRGAPPVPERARDGAPGGEGRGGGRTTPRRGGDPRGGGEARGPRRLPDAPARRGRLAATRGRRPGRGRERRSRRPSATPTAPRPGTLI
jgi:hypothetical protein